MEDEEKSCIAQEGKTRLRNKILKNHQHHPDKYG